MNVELLEKVKEAILEEPLRIDMNTWANEDKSVPCGTVGCIYGWGQAITTKLRGKELWEQIKRKFATITATLDNPFDISTVQASRLYYEYNWPSEYRDKLLDFEPQTPEYAQVVADRIDHFIATEGRE